MKHKITSLAVSLLILLSTSSIRVYGATPVVFYWHPSSSGLPTDDIEALAITPSTLYAGTFGNGVYRSNDNGATWITATTGVTLPMYVQNALAVHPLTPTIVYAGDYYGGGLYRS